MDVISFALKHQTRPCGGTLGPFLTFVCLDSSQMCVSELFTNLEFVLVLFVDPGQQLGLTPVQGVDEGVALRHQTRLELHPVLLKDSEHRQQRLQHRKHS